MYYAVCVMRRMLAKNYLCIFGI